MARIRSNLTCTLGIELVNDLVKELNLKANSTLTKHPSDGNKMGKLVSDIGGDSSNGIQRRSLPSAATNTN